MQLKVKLNY